MLVLADADGFRVDLDELGERILEPAGNRGGGALADVEGRELLGALLGGGVDGGARLVHDHVGDREAGLPDEIRDDGLGLAGGRAVADGDDVDMVLLDQLCEHLFGLCDLVLGRGRVDDRRVEDLAGRVDDAELAAGAEGRVPPEDGLAGDGRLHEELGQVLAEDRDGGLLGIFREGGAQFIFNGGRDQPLVGVGRRLVDVGPGRGVLFHAGLEVQIGHDVLGGSLHLEGEDLLLLAAVQREDAVAGQLVQLLLVFVVVLVDGLGLFVFRFGDDRAVGHGLAADEAAVGGVVRDVLREDVLRHLKGGFCVRDVLLGIDIPGGFRKGVKPGVRAQKELRERGEALLAGDHGAGAALFHIGTVEVLEGDHGLGCLDLFFECRSELALLVDRL